MPFAQSAKLRIASLQSKSPEKLILEFLLLNALGAKNAQPWRLIKNHLESHGIQLSQQAFQQGILKETREGDIFIGSNDHGASKGYFLISSAQDAKTMKEWYSNRINSEKARLANLEQQANFHGWQI